MKVAVMLVHWIALAALALSCSLAFAQSAATVDTSNSAYRLERELDDKREERKARRAAIATNKSVLETFNQAVARVGQVQYPARLKSTLIELEKAAKSAKTEVEARSVVSGIADAYRDFTGAFPNVSQLVNPEDTLLSIEERRILRGITAATIGQLNLTVRRPRSLPLGFPTELVFGEDFAQRMFPGAPGRIAPSEQGVRDAIAELSESKFQAERDRILTIVKQFQNSAIQAVSEAEKSLAALDSETEKLGERLEKARERSSRVDEALIYFALPGLAVLMIGLLVAPKIYKNDKLHLEVFKSGLLLELFTVFFITATILILGLGGRIDAPILGTLLGGISGYVLGRATGRERTTQQASSREDA